MSRRRLVYEGKAKILYEGPEPGTPLGEVLPLSEDVLEIETGFNRPDLTAIYGIAREVAVVTGDELRPPPGVDPEAPAFLQYTSGSTSSPRGVVITHANLVHNSRRIQRCFRTNAESRGVFWLPLYHDMGLIGGVIQTLFCGGTSTLLSPVAFLQRPVRWLQAISRPASPATRRPSTCASTRSSSRARWWRL